MVKEKDRWSSAEVQWKYNFMTAEGFCPVDFMQARSSIRCTVGWDATTFGFGMASHNSPPCTNVQ
jgi:hypothetical protein